MFCTFTGMLLAATLGAREPSASEASAARLQARAPSVAGPSDRTRRRLVAAARRRVGAPFQGDCSGFVRRVYADAGLRLPLARRARSGTEAIVGGMVRTSRPRPGDVAFFHRTHDRDPPGRGRNLFTHVAVVESVHGPRVSLVHRGNAGVQRLRMNLARRWDPKANDALRRRKAGDPVAQRYLASQLLGGFASPRLSSAPGSSAGAIRAARPARSQSGVRLPSSSRSAGSDTD